MILKFHDIDELAAFDGADDVAAVLKTLLRGWVVADGSTETEPARIILQNGKNGIERRSPWVEAGADACFADPVDAACDLLLDLERAYAEKSVGHGGLSILHAAAIEMGAGGERGAVLFPSTFATGKSLLSVACAAAGHRVFADDQVLVAGGAGKQDAEIVAPGFLPRLRVPLPDGLDPALKAYIGAHAGAGSARFLYVDLPDEQLAPLGARAPIKAVVLLQREDGASPSFETLGEAEALKACVLQSFGRTKSALEVLDTLHAMIKGVPIVRLRYGDVVQAVTALQERFS